MAAAHRLEATLVEYRDVLKKTSERVQALAAENEALQASVDDARSKHGGEAHALWQRTVDLEKERDDERARWSAWREMPIRRRVEEFKASRGG